MNATMRNAAVEACASTEVSPSPESAVKAASPPAAWIWHQGNQSLALRTERLALNTGTFSHRDARYNRAWPSDHPVC